MVLQIDSKHKDATLIKAEAFDALGEGQISANARNYFLVSAQRLKRAAQALD